MNDTKGARRYVRPAMVRLLGWANARFGSETAKGVGALHPPQALEVQINCGACGGHWRAKVEGTDAGEIWHTVNGWESQCPHCLRLNVYDVSWQPSRRRTLDSDAS